MTFELLYETLGQIVGINATCEQHKLYPWQLQCEECRRFVAQELAKNPALRRVLVPSGIQQEGDPRAVALEEAAKVAEDRVSDIAGDTHLTEDQWHAATTFCEAIVADIRYLKGRVAGEGSSPALREAAQRVVYEHGCDGRCETCFDDEPCYIRTLRGALSREEGQADSQKGQVELSSTTQLKVPTMATKPDAGFGPVHLLPTEPSYTDCLTCKGSGLSDENHGPPYPPEHLACQDCRGTGREPSPDPTWEGAPATGRFVGEIEWPEEAVSPVSVPLREPSEAAMTEQEMIAIRERCEKATAAPWQCIAIPAEDECLTLPHDHWDIYHQSVLMVPVEGQPNTFRADMTDVRLINIACATFSEDDVDFITNARSDIPALLAEVERLRSLLAGHSLVPKEGQ